MTDLLPSRLAAVNRAAEENEPTRLVFSLYFYALPYFRGGAYLRAVVGPTAKLHGTVLVVEREPGDVYFTRAFENTWRYVKATPVVLDDNVRRIRTVETLIGTINVKLATLDST